MSLGKGVPQSIHPPNRRSTPKFNRNRTVAADDFMPIILWTNCFLRRLAVIKTQLYQDNQSAILLEKNGRKSSSKRTKHLNCRFYFITDRINSNELSVSIVLKDGRRFLHQTPRQTLLQVSQLIMNLQD
jgi:hypothetical protein